MVFLTFFIVLIGWIFSLCLHEFSHAIVAYNGGDYTVREKGYLSFNPLKYTHPIFSIVMPIIFLLLGGIGLPGGAVYIETWRIRRPEVADSDVAGRADCQFGGCHPAGNRPEPGERESHRHLAGALLPARPADLGGALQPDPAPAVRRL